MHMVKVENCRGGKGLFGCLFILFDCTAAHIRICLKYGVHDFYPDRQTDGQR